MFVYGARDVTVPGALLYPGFALADSVSEPAPLIVPGRPAARDSVVTREARALEKARQGAGFERQGQFGPAIMAYRNALDLDPSLRDVHYRMGKLFLAREQLPEAARQFAAELERHPDHFDSHRELGLALARLGDSTRAIARLEQLTRTVPNVDRNWGALGFAYSMSGRMEDAERALRRAIELPPDRAEEQRDLGVLLAATGREPEARAAYQRALALDRQDPTVWFNLGNLERRSSRREEALAAYRGSEAADSAFRPAMDGQVAVLVELGRQAEAGEVYRRWLKRKPDDHTARLAAVQHFASIDREDVALELARDGVRRHPDSPDAHLILGLTRAASGETRAALQSLQAAEAGFRNAASRRQVRDVIAALSREAPDSLRALFVEDSLARAARDSTGR